jgi:predicted nucleic acid-binding Zn ribbon protein
MQYAKLVSAAGFQLKGSGWYATDFKGGGASSNPSSEASKAPATATEGGCGASCACH